MKRTQRAGTLSKAIAGLSGYQRQIVSRIVNVFSTSRVYWRSPTSDLVSAGFLEDFGDTLRVHHSFSREPFSKDKFEYAMESVLISNGVDAALAARGQRGYDLRIGKKKTSLKTEAASAIRDESIHVSKFMELGGGEWSDDPADLVGLRKQFLALLSNTDRILILRALRKGTPDYFYELVEIPKRLLMKAATGRLEMMSSSSQFPKPGYCYVEKDGSLLFSLYFDGGGERKLQVKHLRKDQCVIHASWKFDPPATTL
jgi:type II restriction enzyme